MKYSAGFIGTGNMGGALALAVYKVDERIALCDRHEEKLNALKASMPCADICAAEDLAAGSHFVFLGVKPNVILRTAENLKPFISSETVIVTMAAGVTLNDICTAAGTGKCIRIMPNTPAAVGQGLTLYCCADGITEDEESGFLRLMSSSGIIDKLEEKLFDAAAALSGCGPAYVYMFAQSLADGAVACGLPRAKASLYASQMILGSAEMMMKSEKCPEELKDDVCSPGGTTIEGVMTLEKAGFRAAASNAVIAAYEKTAKLKK